MGEKINSKAEMLLDNLNEEFQNKKKGKLKIFFGYAAGVGKTYAMLSEARELLLEGIDVVVGYVEPHSRPETMELLNGLEKLPEKEISYRGIKIKEFDLDLALQRKPEIILVDELAHSNAKGLRHSKRWQDIEELLSAGIDVYSTVNVQHIESLNDIVETITKISVRETIPDKVVNEATQLKLVDIDPNDLIERFREGKVYKKEHAIRAEKNFFKKENLHALREISLRRIAERVNKDVKSSRIKVGNLERCPTKEILLACISASPTAGKVIRTAARIAGSLNVPWIGIYVENKESGEMDLEEKEQLRKNIALAESLGAEISILHGEDVVNEILNLAKIKSISRIVIGRNHRVGLSGIYKHYRKDIVDKLIELSEDIEIHVIPSKVNRERPLARIKNKKFEEISPYIKVNTRDIIRAILIILVCTIISLFSMKLGFSDHNILLIYILGVLFISVSTEGYLIGAVAAFVNALIFNYCFTDPKLTFSVNDSSYLTTVPFFLVASIITSVLATRVRIEAKSSFAKEEKTQLLYQISRSFLQIMGHENVIDHGLELINSSLQRNVIFFEKQGNDLKELFYFKANLDITEECLKEKSEIGVARWVYKNNEVAGAGTDTIPGTGFKYIPIIGYKNSFGVIGIDCLDGLINKNEEIFLETIIVQMALALDREELYRKEEENKIAIEREKLKNNLLRAISHDLRTPLTGIVGSSALILENKNKLSEETLDELLKGINEEGQWLISLVENLLSMTKIDEGKLELKKSEEVVDDIVYDAINHLSFKKRSQEIKIDLPKEVLVVPMDGKLISQVLVNLIDNAIKYTSPQSKIIVSVSKEEDEAVFRVIDNGKGIDEKDISKIFDQFFTANSNWGDSKRGIGLGLAICKAIIEAHRGVIKVYNNKMGGATFVFKLKL
ncbi:MAG: ATP-binding protein [Sarcina sp.]